MGVNFVTFLATYLSHFLVDTVDSGLLKSYFILQCTERQGHIPEVTLQKVAELGTSLAVKTWRFHCRGPGSIPSLGTKIPHASWHGRTI